MPPSPLRPLLARWHRRLGLVAALFLLFSAGTGMLINHDAELGLDREALRADWLLAWYGIAPGGPSVSFAAGGHWVTAVEGVLYLDGMRVDEGFGAIRGAASLSGLVAAAGEDRLVLLTPGGEMVERLTRASLPGPVRRLAGDGRHVYVESPAGVFVSDDALLEWARADAEPAWSRPRGLPSEVADRIDRDFRGHGLTLDRLLRDLHSGRLFGSRGPWMMDAAGLALLLLAATGLANGLRRR